MSEILTISGDFSLLEMLTIQDTLSEDDKTLTAVIHAGKNEFVDALIDCLHFRLTQKARRNIRFAFALTG